MNKYIPIQTRVKPFRRFCIYQLCCDFRGSWVSHRFLDYVRTSFCGYGWLPARTGAHNPHIPTTPWARAGSSYRELELGAQPLGARIFLEYASPFSGRLLVFDALADPIGVHSVRCRPRHICLRYLASTFEPLFFAQRFTVV